MYWSQEDVARERVRDLHRDAARRRDLKAARPRPRDRADIPWWRELMGLPSAPSVSTVRPAL